MVKLLPSPGEAFTSGNSSQSPKMDGAVAPKAVEKLWDPGIRSCAFHDDHGDMKSTAFTMIYKT